MNTKVQTATDCVAAGRGRLGGGCAQGAVESEEGLREDGAIPNRKERRNKVPGSESMQYVCAHTCMCLFACVELCGFCPRCLLYLHPRSVVFSDSEKSSNSKFHIM